MDRCVLFVFHVSNYYGQTYYQKLLGAAHQHEQLHQEPPKNGHGNHSNQ